jgi:hypothetical protein
MSEALLEQDTPLTKQESPPTRLIPVTEWTKFFPYPTLGSLRFLIFHANTNGFAKVVKRLGRRVLIDERAFFEYVEEQTKEANKAK